MYKRIYDPADIAEVRAWFAAHEGKLPAELQLDDATRFTRLPDTVTSLLEVARLHEGNPTFSGQLHQLFLIRERLLELGIDA